jgi:hypothetical protein
MMKRLIILALGVFGFLGNYASNALAGGLADVLSVEYDPIMQSKNGRINNCGIHFKVAIRKDGRIFAVQGSVNELFFKGKIPLISSKIIVLELKNKKLSLSHLTSAYIQGQNFTTMDFNFNKLSSDTGAWLAFTNIIKSPKLFTTFISSLYERPWVGFNLGDANIDFTFQLPSPKKKSIMNDTRKCSLRAISNIQNEMQNK